jgi:hypothetical protein
LKDGIAPTVASADAHRKTIFIMVVGGRGDESFLCQSFGASDSVRRARFQLRFDPPA